MFGKKCDWKKCRNLSVILGLLSLCIMTLIAVYATGWKEDNLKWVDDFDVLDETKWQHVVSGNRGYDNEFQYFRRDKRNSYVTNGALHLKATLVGDEVSDSEVRGGLQDLPGCNEEPCVVRGDPEGDCILPVYSAQLHTKQLFRIKSGRVEVRARFPSGDWLRPEIALLHSTDGSEEAAEIRIAEGCGNKYISDPDGHSLGADTVGQGIRRSTANLTDRAQKTLWTTTLPAGYFSDAFHVFEAEWTPGHIIFRVDGTETGRLVPPGGGPWELGPFTLNIPEFLSSWSVGTAMAPFDREFYLVVKLSVGGSYFEDQLENLNYPKPWNSSGGRPVTDFYENSPYYAPTWDRPELEIDYVRIYQH
ncbi:UNVERIFIED_CONTAM: hypothetical protein PYX00_000089 [Menopon gallinae]|uniref:GH16 domain-containing protein n=1 Tax=Menopon gallinae TaxID=328185 RepID=A0AAW2I7S8_9NEOP